MDIGFAQTIPCALSSKDHPMVPDGEILQDDTEFPPLLITESSTDETPIANLQLVVSSILLHNAKRTQHFP